MIAPYLLNTIVLKPGEAIFLAANEPHAYVASPCRMCVLATSDTSSPAFVQLLGW